MKKLNCNSLMQQPVDDKVMQKLLQIPEQHSRKGAVPIFRFRMIAAAAALVLVSACSVAVAIWFGSSVSPVPVSSPDLTASEAQVPTVTPSDSAAITPDSAQSPSQSEAVGSSDTEDQRISQNERNQHNDTSSDDRPSNDRQTVKPTEDQPDNPVHHTDHHTDHEQEPPQPTEPPSPAETDPPITVSNTCYGQVYERLYTERMYCFIADTASNIYGDSDLFSDQHLATVEQGENGWLTVSYNPDDHGIISQADTYSYAFYNDEGAIVYSDSAYFSAAEGAGEGGEG